MRWSAFSKQAAKLLTIGASLRIFGFGGISRADSANRVLNGAGGFYTDDDRYCHAIVATSNGVDLKRSDGTTVAHRLFDRQFPNLFTWVMERMDGHPSSEFLKNKQNLKALCCNVSRFKLVADKILELRKRRRRFDQ